MVLRNVENHQRDVMVSNFMKTGRTKSTGVQNRIPADLCARTQHKPSLVMIKRKSEFPMPAIIYTATATATSTTKKIAKVFNNLQIVAVF